MTNTDSTSGQNTTNSQLEQANAVLLEMSGNVTTDDRKDAMRELGYSRFTIGLCLRGFGRNLDTVIKLIEFFRERIDERNKVLTKD